MNKSITYLLSWAGLLGILSTQTYIISSYDGFHLWHSFVLFTALLPIKGFIQNQRYTFQWTGFLSLFFLCVGVSNFFEAATPQSASFILLCSSVVLYFGVVFHAKKLAYYAAIEKAKQAKSA